MTAAISETEIRDYFARHMNSIRESEGLRPYTAEEIAACWDTMTAAERVEWEDSALADKMDEG